MLEPNIAQLREEISLLRAEQQRHRHIVYAVQIATAIIVFLLVARAAAQDAAALREDLRKIPAEERKFFQYFSVAHIPEDRRAEVIAALKMVAVSMTRTVAIEPTIPTSVSPTLFKVDLRVMKWDKTLPKFLAEKYPYAPTPGRRTYVIDAQWFMSFFLDSRYSGDAYQQLLFGVQFENEQAYLNLFKANLKSPFLYTWQEDESRVALQRRRLLNVAPTSRHEPIWFTRDFSPPMSEATDPLANLLKDPKHDASEIIAALPKRILSTGEGVHMQAYALFAGPDAENAYQDNAPIDIVHDYSGTGPELRNPISCFSCHDTGLLEPNVSALRRYIKAGAEVFADIKNRNEIEARFLTVLSKRIERWNEDYTSAVDAACGLTPVQASAAIRGVYLAYRADMELTDVARELKVKPDVLTATLSRLPAGNIPARVAGLAHGVPISRDDYEEHWPFLYGSLYQRR